MTNHMYTIGDKVTITDHRLGRLALIISAFEEGIRHPTWVILTDAGGYGRWRRPLTDLTPGWGN